MKSKVLVSVIFFFIFLPVLSYSDFTLNGGLMFDRNEKKPVFGANLDWPKFNPSDNISLTLGYTFSLNINGFYTSAPGLIGIALIGLDIADTDDEDDENGGSNIAGSLGVLLVVIPENI